MFVCINGEFVPRNEAKVSVFDHGFLYGDGVYDTTRTFNGVIWKPFEHLGRLRRSAAALAIDYAWSDQELLLWCENLLKKNAYQGESRIRFMITRGCNGFSFKDVKAPTCVILAEQLSAVPEEVYFKGVAAVTVPFARFLPEVKTISLLPQILAQLEVERRGVYEAFFVDWRGYVTEGSISNVFMVKDAVLKTPDQGILAGITRDVVLELCCDSGIRVSLEAFSTEELYRADECFMTSSVKGIVPVVSLNSDLIGVGRPGDTTLRLIEAYKQSVL